MDSVEIRDEAVDVEQVMAEIRANVARRRAEGAYGEDLVAVTRDVFAAEGLRPAQAIRMDDPARLASAAPYETSPAVQALTTQWMVREQPFVSHAALLGPLIVRVREAWNWMSTKWYVRPLLQQITQFHLSVVRAFQDLDGEQQRLAEQVQRLENLCQRQAADIEALRREVARLNTLASLPDDDSPL